MRGEAWNDDSIDLLKKLWGEGETAAAIATKLGGFSRSSVLGKVFRLRLAPRETADAPPLQAECAAKNQARAHDGRVPPAVEDGPVRRRQTPRRYKPSTPAGPAKGRAGKTLFELTNECCRWPYRRPGTERYFFCGVPEADLGGGIPYCARHMKRAYNLPPRLVPQSRAVASRAAQARRRP